MAKYLLNLAVMAGALAASSAYAQVADVALINGKIYTADAGDAVVTAPAVSGNRFLAVGSDEAVRPHIGAKPQVLDLKGGIVSPGLTEAHLPNAQIGRASRRASVVKVGMSWGGEVSKR